MAWKAIFSKLGQRIESVRGTPVQPDSTEGLRTYLAGLSALSAESHRRDPRLKEIIVTLRGLPKGTYHRDTFRSDAKRIKGRMYKYRLASNGVLVSQPDDDNPHLDRPAVPEVTYTITLKDAPKGMTWKHILLGAVHNTITGGHRNAASMQNELNQLIVWWLPESLRTDCAA